MSERDEIDRKVLEGDPYDRAAVLERRVFPLSVGAKIRCCVVALASSSVLTPLLYLRQSQIEQLEGTQTLGETLSPALSTLALTGSLSTFVFGLLLVWILALVQSRTLSETEARRIVRVEDMLMVFATIGILSILTALLFASIGALSTEATIRLYDANISFYSSGGPVSVDSRIVSVVGPVFAGILYGLFGRYRRR